MSFLNIEDPKKRDAIVSDYIATVKRLQQKNLNEKAEDLVRQDDIERALEPVVRSTGKSTETITNELIPIKEEIKALNLQLKNQENHRDGQKEKVEEEEEEEEEKELLPNIVQVYYEKLPKEKLDKYFGVIREGGNRYKMGDKYVRVKQSDLIVDNKKYIGTRGLWSLIMRKRPTDYTADDLATYRDVILQTNAMNSPNNVEPTSRVTSTKKWRDIFSLFGDLDRGLPSRSDAEAAGHGLVFLPGDIKGLETKLTYLLGEYRAGNRTSTRNEIVSILDELLRRKSISRKEYNDINNFLQ